MRNIDRRANNIIQHLVCRSAGLWCSSTEGLGHLSLTTWGRGRRVIGRGTSRRRDRWGNPHRKSCLLIVGSPLSLWWVLCPVALWDRWWELLCERHTQIWETGILMTTGGLNPFHAAPLLILCLLFLAAILAKSRHRLHLSCFSLLLFVRIQSHFNKEKNILFLFCNK